MPVNTTPAPGVENKPPGEVELEDAEEGNEDKLYCICETRYDDERVMIACDRCAALGDWVAICSYSLPTQLRRVVSHVMRQHARPRS